MTRPCRHPGAVRRFLGCEQISPQRAANYLSTVEFTDQLATQSIVSKGVRAFGARLEKAQTEQIVSYMSIFGYT